MGQSDVAGAGGFAALLISLIASIAGNIGQALPRADRSCAEERCVTCGIEVAALRAEVRFTLYVGIVFSIFFVAVVGCFLWRRRPHSASTARSAEKSVGSEAARFHPVVSTSDLPTSKTVAVQLSQADLNEHRRGPRR